MAVNTSVIGASNWFNNTIRNGGQKEAPGSASNNTIAAAATTTQQTAATPAQTTPSRSNTQTGKKKDDDRRSQSAGASALQESINSGKSTSTKSTRNTTTQPTVKPKISGVVTETQTGAIKSIEQTNVAKGLASEAGIYDVGINIEASQSVTPIRPKDYVSIEQQREFFDASGGLKLSGTLDARQTIDAQVRKALMGDQIIGNTYSTIQTLFTDPVGRPNLTNNIFEQFDAYDRYDGSGDQRKTAAVLAAVEIPSYIAGGGVAGVGGKVAQTAINKLGSTVLGNKIVNIATSPLIKSESKLVKAATTPTAAIINLGTIGYGVDVGNRIAKQPSAEQKISYAGNIVLKEIPASIAGVAYGYRMADKVSDVLSTFKKTEIPYDKIVAPGIPFGNYNEKQLQQSFMENRLIPNPVDFARTNNKKNYGGSVSLHPDNSDIIEAIHATDAGAYFGKHVTIAEGKSEVSGIWTAPKAIEHFLGNLNNMFPNFKLFVTEFGRTPESKIINIQADPNLKFLDWNKAANDIGKSVAEVMQNKKLRKEVGDAYINKNTQYGELISPALKREYEAVLKPGTELKRLKRKYYTKAPSGKVIPIDEYIVTNAPLKTQTQQPRTMEDINVSNKRIIDDLSSSGKYILIDSLGLVNRGLLKREYVLRNNDYIRIDTYEIIKNKYGLPILNENKGVSKSIPKTTLISRINTGKGIEIEEHRITTPKITQNKITHDTVSSNYNRKITQNRITHDTVSSNYNRKTNKKQIPAVTGIHSSNISSRLPSSLKISIQRVSGYNINPSDISITSSYTQAKSIPISRVHSESSIKTSNVSIGYNALPKINSYGLSSRKFAQMEIKPFKIKEDNIKTPQQIYSAVRTGRIDHLSIKDPLEFYGTGKSITNRNRPDRVLNKQALYFVDNAITTRRPSGRRKVKP